MSDHNRSDHEASRQSVNLPAAQIARRRDRAILRVCQMATRHLQHGRLRLTLPSGESAFIGHAGATGARDSHITLTNFKVFRKALQRGSIGFAEAYMAGDLQTNDLGDVFRFFLANKTDLNAAGRGHFKVRLPDKIWHWRRDNTRTGSQRNIAAHYDLGNAFYAPWLDASMTYSSALYATPDQTLEAAQADKLDMIIAALKLQPGQHVLEIGCGWGALSERIAQAGCRVTAVTVSAEQLAYAQQRIAAAGLADTTEIRFQDYRDITGEFDRIVSIEMIEAVGEAHWPSYFATLQRCLKPGGHAIIQSITIDEAQFAAYRAKADFIQRYIFPGGMLPTPTLLKEHARLNGLTTRCVKTFGLSYAATLRAWRSRFEAAWPSLVPLGFDDRFRRMWLYYLSYCEVGFEQAATDVGLYHFAKPAVARTTRA
jgi:cyclopropane-fatty-acyl-phospholipid synthase